MAEITLQDIIQPENLVYEKSKLLTEKPFHYCPGCGHGTVHRIIAEVLEELGVEHNVIAVGRNHWGDFFRNLLHFFGIDALDKIEEHSADFVEHISTLFKSLNGVGERRGFSVVYYSVDFGLLAFHALLESGKIVLGLYFLEVRDVVGRVPFPEERVVHIVLVFA